MDQPGHMLVFFRYKKEIIDPFESSPNIFFPSNFLLKSSSTLHIMLLSPETLSCGRHSIDTFINLIRELLNEQPPMDSPMPGLRQGLCLGE